MRKSSEFPSAAVESSLSAILERRVPPKFYLSAKACSGILRRAARRGRELPALLKEALERVAGPLLALEPVTPSGTPEPGEAT